MTLITDKSRQPSLEELSAYTGNALFDALTKHLQDEYGASYSVDFSGDKVLLGWNVRFFKSSRTLCRIYPRPRDFMMLLVVGKREKERVEALLPSLSPKMREIYESTKEGMGQRWLLFELSCEDEIYRDALKLIAIRRASK